MTKRNEDTLEGFAVASVLCGLVSWVAFAIVFAPLGIIFGMMSLKSNKTPVIICGTIGLMVSAVSFALWFISMLTILSFR